MNRIITTIVAVPALLAASVAVAQEAERPNFKYFELDYVYSEVNVKSPSLDGETEKDTWYVPNGLALSGSWVFAEQLLIRGSYYGGSGEWKKTYKVNLTTASASIGYLPRTTDATGIDMSLEYRQDGVEFDGPSDNNVDEKLKGPGISFGLRTAPSPRTEIGLRGGWYEGDYGGAIAFSANFGFNFSDRWGLNAFWERLDTDTKDGVIISNYELNKYGVGARVFF
jgi:hypothetical protein